MELLNVSAWRLEPEQVVSDVTARLISWMARIQLGAGLDAEEVASEIHDGLKQLIDARAGVVLVRRLPGGHLVPAAATCLQSGEAEPTDKDDKFDPAALLAVLPNEPFFLEQASPQLQVLIGELADFVREVCNISAAKKSAPENNQPSLVVPLVCRSDAGPEELMGLALLWVETLDGLISETLRAPLEVAALQSGGWLASTLQIERVGASYRNLGEALANAIDQKDVHRTGHSTGVSYYSSITARSLGLPAHEVERIEFAALLHAIGKITVPDAILLKESALSRDELDVIRNAVVTGAEWLCEVDGLAEVAAMVRHQGERFDGSGFPDGLSGEDIPIGARILAVALRFAAMTQPRADRRAMSVVGGALEALAADSGKSLDPRVVNAFLAAMGRTL
ncbi:MAG TPA: HD domain-containing phosphohydrolase [Abditibacteriaceae bacterium]